MCHVSQVVVDAVLVEASRRPSPGQVVSLLGRLIWLTPKLDKGNGVRDAAVFETLCQQVVDTVKGDGYVRLRKCNL